MFNKAIFIGNLTKDIEMRYTPKGIPVATMRLAVTTKYKQGNEIKDDTLFINAIAFGNQADACSQHLSKGSPVLIEGRLRENRWESGGVQKSRIEVICNTVRFLRSKESNSQNYASSKYNIPPEEVTDTEPF